MRLSNRAPARTKPHLANTAGGLSLRDVPSMGLDSAWLSSCPTFQKEATSIENEYLLTSSNNHKVSCALFGTEVLSVREEPF